VYTSRSFSKGLSFAIPSRNFERRVKEGNPKAMTDNERISRRRFLSAAATTAATTCIPAAGAIILAGDAAKALAQYSHIDASREAPAAAPLVVEHSGYRLLIDSAKGAIVSFSSRYGAGRELLVPTHANLPLFKMELMDDHFAFKALTSSEAKHVSMRKESDAGEQTVTIEFTSLAELPLDARVTIRCPTHEPLTYWNLELDNRTGDWIGHVQFPVVEVPFDHPGDGDPGHILSSIADGQLAGPVEASMWGEGQRNTPEVWRSNNYPGQWTSTQLMAYYNRAGGLYAACDDPIGLPKYIGPLMEDEGVTMGLGHFPGTRGPGKYRLPYNVVLGAFQGDWYVAAEIYRNWTSQQTFCNKKMSQRSDVPKWISESPVAIAFPMRGHGDWDAPAAENPEYTPATHALPFLDKLAAELECSLIPIVFNWENGGPWVQPDAFPPVGGEAAMREFMAAAKERGWHPMIYGDGLCWVTSQTNTGYDGLPYFRAHGGEQAVSRTWDGKLAEDIWAWRRNYVTCVGAEKGRQTLLGMTRGMAEFRPDVIQQFDQGPGPRACYSNGHGHPPVPGPWMIAEFNSLLKADREEALSINAGLAMSCEGAPPETCLQEFQIWDARSSLCPLYSFLFHEFANAFQGFYTNRVSDEALRASVARAVVTGYMVNLTLRDKGLISYDWDQTWSRAIPDQNAVLDWTKRLNRFRAGVARDYLIYGRMLRPWTVTNVTERDLGWGKEPLAPSATWQAPDGRIGVVLANYSDLGESPRVELQGDGKKNVTLHIDAKKTERAEQLPTVIDIELEPRSICLIEVA
jgi:hypothetical protein